MPDSACGKLAKSGARRAASAREMSGAFERAFVKSRRGRYVGSSCQSARQHPRDPYDNAVFKTGSINARRLQRTDLLSRRNQPPNHVVWPLAETSWRGPSGGGLLVFVCNQWRGQSQSSGGDPRIGISPQPQRRRSTSPLSTRNRTRQNPWFFLSGGEAYFPRLFCATLSSFSLAYREELIYSIQVTERSA